MTVQEFCVAYGFPLTKTSRAARRMVIQALDLPKTPSASELKRRSIDVKIPGAGLAARKRAGLTRITYEVTNPAEFRQALLGEVGYSAVLTDKHIEVLVDGARWAYNQIQAGGRLDPQWKSWVDNLGRVLKRAGGL